jgi:hypothetical protein
VCEVGEAMRKVTINVLIVVVPGLGRSADVWKCWHRIRAS